MPPISHGAAPSRRSTSPRWLVMAACAFACGVAGAAEVVVRVTGLTAGAGQIGCSLFADAEGFPLRTAKARAHWVDAAAAGATCRFADVAPGTYAVAVGLDLNGNRRVDTNFVGQPTEPWGVSRGARHSLRAPRFDEASFEVGADAPRVEIEVELAR
jgi:uncharacterized protein (DUF2141 family)